MKIIYEDPNEHGEDLLSEGEGFFGSAVPPEVKSVRSSRKPKKEEEAEPQREKEPAPQQSEPKPAAVPEFRLTKEQVAILLQQYLSENPDAFSPSEGEGTTQNALVSTAPQTESAKRAGTRIVFQSPDFDQPEEPHQRLNGPVIPQESDYDFDEEDEDDELPPVRALPKKIDDMDYTIDEIDLEAPKAAPSAKKEASAPIIRRRDGSYVATDLPVQPSSVNSPVSTVSTGTPLPSGLVVEDVEETKGKKNSRPVGEIVRLVVLSVSIIAIVIASAVLIREYKLHKDNQALESDVSNLIIGEEEQSTTKKNNKAEKTDVTETTLSVEQKWAQIRAEYPNTIFPPNIQLKYAKLYATNNDFVGYLEAKGVGLSLPVVQTDNDEVYLNKNFYGEKTKYGCPFVTYLNNIEPLDLNTVIFGHHMNDKTIFGALDNYKDIEGFKSAPVITFNTLYKNYKWKVIAAFITNAYAEDDNDYIFRYYFTSLSTQERFSAYLNELAQRSLYDTGVDVLPTDKLLTLSTCSHEFEDARFVVVARLVRAGESEEVDVSKATVNSNPRFPQAYYNAKKLTNPYYNAARWDVE